MSSVARAASLDRARGQRAQGTRWTPPGSPCATEGKGVDVATLGGQAASRPCLQAVCSIPTGSREEPSKRSGRKPDGL